MRHFKQRAFSILFVLGLVSSTLPSASAMEFVRADANDDGKVDISDVITSLGVLFLGKGFFNCDDAADSNDDGQLDISDPVLTLGVLFGGRGAVPAPGIKRCGPDPTKDELGCKIYHHCESDVEVTVVSETLRFEGKAVDVLPSGEVIREVAIHAGRRFEWNGRRENRVAKPERLDLDEEPFDIDKISVEELADNLRGLALYQGHEFIETEPAFDLARNVKRYRELVNQGASDRELEKFLPPLQLDQGDATPTEDFARVEGQRVLNPGPIVPGPIVPIDPPIIPGPIVPGPIVPGPIVPGPIVPGLRGDKIVHGPIDDRFILNNFSYPHRTQIVFDNSGSSSVINGSQGSGSMIGRSTAMSVAHVFWNEGGNTWESDHRWAPGFDSQDSDSSPWGDWYRCYWVTIPWGYVIFENSGYDYAVLDFDVGCNSVKNGVNSDRPGNTVGWLGTWTASASTIESRIGFVRGYPGSPGSGCGNSGQNCNVRIWGDVSFPGETDAKTLSIRHQADTTGGQSGSGFYIYSGSGPYLVGMHRAGASAYNLCRRYTSAVSNFMKAASGDW